jgi:hypothetical protein
MESKLPPDQLPGWRQSLEMQQTVGCGNERLAEPGVELAQHKMLQPIATILDQTVTQVGMEYSTSY